jgi:hypothetical protein
MIDRAISLSVEEVATVELTKMSGRFFHQVMVLLKQLILGFDMLGINGNAVNRTNLDTLTGFEMSDAFGAQLPVDFVDDFALIDCIVRAFRFANITIDAVISYKQSQCEILIF